MVSRAFSILRAIETGSMAAGVMSVALPILDGSNYQIWQIRMQAFLEGADLWEAVEDDYEVPPLGDNPTVAQIRANRERVTRKAKARSSLYAAITPIICLVWYTEKHVSSKFRANRILFVYVKLYNSLLTQFSIIRAVSHE